MSEAEIIEKTRAFIEQKFKGEDSGHDYWHMYRVWELSKHIGKNEKDANMLVVQLAALLHDIADHKFHDDDMEIGKKKAREWLEKIDVDEKIIQQVEYIVRYVSFKASKVGLRMPLEGQIVYDADKLDALGAVGIARLFTMSGHLGRPLYIPNPPPENELDENSKKWGISSIQHFYDKLLLLKDNMFTKTGKQMAEHRHKYIEDYLEEFYAEWEGKV
jgi:uncharacterized protein